MKWYYAEPLKPHLSEKELEGLLASSKTADVQTGMLFSVLHENDCIKSESLILNFIDGSDEVLKRSAIISISHLARIHKNINLGNFCSILNDFLEDQNGIYADEVESALKSIWTFCEGAQHYTTSHTNDTCVARFFGVLASCDQFENDEDYDKGISFFEGLKSKEVNISVKKIIDESILYLRKRLRDQC